MKKVRVYELAKEFGLESKVLTAQLKDLGYSVKAYNSTLDDVTAAEIRERFSGGATAKAKVKTKTKTPAKEPVRDEEEVVTSTSTTTIDNTEVEDKRIQSKGRTTIIRRRRKKVEEAAPEPPETPEVVETPEAVESTEDKAPKKEVEEVTAGGKPAAEKAEEPAEASAPEEEAGTTEPEKETPQAETTEPDEVQEGDRESTEVEEKADKEVETPAVDAKAESGDKEAPEETNTPPKVDKSRKGLARIIKKSAIKLPVEEERPYASAKRHSKGKSSRAATSAAPGRRPNDYGAGRPGAPAGGPHGPGKGKKGKRFVKFHHDAAPRGKKGFKKKGYATVDMEDVAMAGGRFSAALRVGRGPKSGRKGKSTSPSQAAETKAIKKRIKVYDTISIGDLAHRMGVKANELIAKLMGLGVMATVNQALDVETAMIVASEFGYEVEQAETEEITISNLEDQESGGEMEPRPPVVTVMGHVDHGKTSILDAIRSTDVAEGEAGGITQHIGAHYVRSVHGDLVFLDTPGHAAFTEMRSRGAKVTDIVVLVVAADDGVMDQTKEAINHAKAAEVPIVVAVNKIDKDGADPMRVKRELAEYDLVPEDWGGSTIFCETSAKTKKGIDDLLEQILLQAEILELKADKNRKARGRVIEAKLHKGRGPVATIVVQQGTLRLGDSFVAGDFYGRVKSLLNDKGQRVKEGYPSWAVEVQGLNGVPRAGDEFVVVKNEKMAKSVAHERQMKSREKHLGMTSKVSLENLFDKLQDGNVKELKVLLRADVQGTLEAFAKSLEKLSTDKVRVKIIHQGTGGIIDSDVLLAAASEAIIIGFNVRPSPAVQDFAAKEGVDVRYYDVIYHALEDIEQAMTGMLDPVYEERIIGSVEVRDIFSAPKIGTIAGCYVNEGKIERGAMVRLLRDDVVVHTGKVASLRRFKDDAKDVAAGYECGVTLENYGDIKKGDLMEVYVLDEVAATL